MLALTFALTNAQPAQAEPAFHGDQRHDVVTFDEEGGVLHRPHTPDPDVVATKLAHVADRVTIRLTYANLRRDPQSRTTRGRIDTPDARFTFRSVLNETSGAAKLTLHKQGQVVACPDLRQTVSYSENRLRLSVPRTCVGNPRWVQIGVLTGLDRPGTFGWWDDALRDGTNPAFTPKLSRKLDAPAPSTAR